MIHNYVTISDLFVDRIESQDEIHKLIEEVFQDKKQLSLEDFQVIIE